MNCKHPDFELFDRFKQLASDLGMTAAVVQNDHDLLIADGLITADQVRVNLAQFVSRCENHISELQSLESATVRRLDAVAAALVKRSTTSSEND